MDEEEEENIIIELNSRFKEMRTLMITIGSILALLMPVVNQMGIIDFGVDILVDELDDENQFDICLEDWRITDASYIIGNEITLSFRASDINLCGVSHNATLSIEKNHNGISESTIQNTTIKNTRAFSFEPEIVENGEWIFFINLYSVNVEQILVKSNRLFSVDNSQEETKIYGCIDSQAVNYNEDATDDDGSCEYEQIEESNCTAQFYDVIIYWAENNTSIYSDFDVDYTCESYGNVTVELEIFDLNNESTLLASTLQYETYFYEVDYRNIDFYNVTIPHTDYLAHFKLKTENEIVDDVVVDLSYE